MPDEELKKMTFSEHFEELRLRLFVSLGSVVVFFVICFIFREYLKDLVLAPYESLRHASMDAEGNYALRKLVFIRPTEKFVFYLKMCFFTAVLFSGPVILHQMWRFIAAGLYRHERKPVTQVLPLSLALFATGMVFGYLVLFPIGLRFLLQFGDTETLDASISVSAYFSLFTLLILLMGFIFQTPLVMVVLCRVGITTPDFFASRRKYFILGAFVVGALLTPPDWITQCLLAGPLVVLFEVGIHLSRIMGRRAARRAAAEAGEETTAEE